MPCQEEEESAEQPLWQSVLVFCCKGMIEAIIVLLFIWLLVQVLFTKNLEVQLQVLLGVGLAGLCLSLILGCILCLHYRRVPPQDKDTVMSFPGDHMSPTPTADPLSSSADTTSVKQQYEELDGDTLELPSPFSCSTPSEGDSAHMPFIPRPRAASEMNEHPKSFFPLRRLGTSAASPSSSLPSAYSRASLPSLPKLGLLSMTRRALERHCTVPGDSLLHDEHSRLTSPSLSTPSTDSVFQVQTPPQEPPLPRYGSSSSYATPAPQMSFTLLFSTASGTLTVHVFSITGVSQGRTGRVSVRASLPPLCPAPLQVLTQRPSLSCEFQSQSFVLQVGSLEELRRCTLHMAVYTRDLSGLTEAPQGELELPCGEVDWELDRSITCTKQLSPAQPRLRKALSSLDGPSQRGWAGSPQALGQLFVLLQYQALAHRIKVMVRKAENLTKLSCMPGAPDHYVIINLRCDGTVISTKETKGVGGCNAVWNTPFLFDLPPGDVTQLSIVLEFIVMQGRVYTKSSRLGRVLIGVDAPEAGQAHWKDMCSQEQVETACWHTIQP